MPDNQDWLNDPFLSTSRAFPKHLDSKSVEVWRTFHFSTRLKLEGAEYFCRQVFGAASMPDDLGLPLLAHRQFKWFLDAFFFELMAAWNTLLQELNIVFSGNAVLDMEDVKWDSIKGNIPEKLRQYIDTEYQSKWFQKVRRYRNTATHHAYVPAGSWKGGSGDKPTDYDDWNVSIFYMSRDSRQFEEEKISVCKDYLYNMVRFISEVWNDFVTILVTSPRNSADS